MANSGTVYGNNVTVSSPYYARVRVEWQLASQNTSGNYSTINWQAYTDFFGCDAQLNNGNVGSSVGTLWSNGGEVHAYSGNFSNHTVTMASGSFNIGADGSGNTTLNMSGSIVVYSSGTSSGSGSWSLPTINRYAVIDGGPNINDVTDEWIEFAWHADRSCDYATWWSIAYDGGGHHDFSTSGQGWWTIDLHNLASGKQYDFTVGIRNAASGLWTFSSAIYATTHLQNNFARGRVL
jgi:hypothetical protein